MEDTNPLQQAIQDQIETYLPQYQLNKVEVSKKSNNELSITIEVEQTIYQLETTKNGDLRLSNLA